jgi:hypothetical protein
MIAAEDLIPVRSAHPGMVELEWREGGYLMGHFAYKAGIGFLVRKRAGWGPPWSRAKSMHTAIRDRLLELAGEVTHDLDA